MRAFAIGFIVVSVGLIAVNCLVISVVLMKVRSLIAWDQLRHIVTEFAIMFLVGGLYNSFALLMIYSPSVWTFIAYALCASATAFMCAVTGFQLFNLMMGSGRSIPDVINRLRNTLGML